MSPMGVWEWLYATLHTFRAAFSETLFRKLLRGHWLALWQLLSVIVFILGIVRWGYGSVETIQKRLYYLVWNNMINLSFLSVTSTNLRPDHVGAVLPLWSPRGWLPKSHPHGDERKLHFLRKGPASSDQRCEGHSHRQQGQTGKSTHQRTFLSPELSAPFSLFNFPLHPIPDHALKHGNFCHFVCYLLQDNL